MNMYPNTLDPIFPCLHDPSHNRCQCCLPLSNVTAAITGANGVCSSQPHVRCPSALAIWRFHAADGHIVVAARRVFDS